MDFTKVSSACWSGTEFIAGVLVWDFIPNGGFPAHFFQDSVLYAVDAPRIN